MTVGSGVARVMRVEKVDGNAPVCCDPEVYGGWW